MSLDGERAQLEAAARAAYPHEACGVVLERNGARMVLPCVNDAPLFQRKTRFRLHAADYARIIAFIADGWRLDTIWHSHPEQPSTFSTTDAREALFWNGTPKFPGAIHKVVSVVGEEGPGFTVTPKIASWSAVQWVETIEGFVDINPWPREPVPSEARPA